MRASQASLFDLSPAFPEGFGYQPNVLTREEEADLAARFAELHFRAFEFHGYLGKRRVVYFGWRYDFNGGGLQRAEPMPEFILPLREKAAALGNISPDDLPHVLITEYAPGAGIGWHRDRPQFATVIGASLLAPCTFRFRRKAGTKWERASFTAEPRAAYVLDGPARAEWEHSIPPLDALRYSVTFRSLRPDLRKSAEHL